MPAESASDGKAMVRARRFVRVARGFSHMGRKKAPTPDVQSLHGPPPPVADMEPAPLPGFESNSTETYAPVTMTVGNQTYYGPQYHRVENTISESRTVIGNDPDDPDPEIVLTHERAVLVHHHQIAQAREKKINRERPFTPVPKSSVKGGEKSKINKTAPIRRVNLPSPEDVPCPECSMGLQDLALCTICDGAGRITKSASGTYWENVTKLRNAPYETA